MKLIDADALINEIKKETEKAIEQDDKVGSFWLGYIAGLVIKQPTIQPVATDMNVGDTISRQAAIDALDCINGTEEVLRSLPSAQPKPQWIPCSEKLPEEAGYYITSSEYGGVTVDFYYDHFWNSWKNAYKVLAWMPLPKIYKPNK